MFLVTDPPLNYGNSWETLEVICHYRPSHLFLSALQEAKRRAPKNQPLEAIQIAIPTAIITAIYVVATKTVIAQIETLWQDGCAPPVHIVLASKQPNQLKYHGPN